MDAQMKNEKMDIANSIGLFVDVLNKHLNQITERLCDGIISENMDEQTLINDYFFSTGIKIDKTKIFPMVVLATMSSGKSTLINALLGKEILPSSNEACTALTYSILDDDSDSKELVCITDKYGRRKIYEDDLAAELRRINVSKDIRNVFIRSHVKGILNTDKALLIIDTPGPNNSRDESHKDILFNTMTQMQGGLFLYILNVTQLGINDDKELMSALKTIINKKPQIKVLFVLNKIDQLDEDEESIEDFVMIAREYVESCGFFDSEIIPVSARAAILFKKVLAGEKLTRLENRDFLGLYDLYKPMDFNMRKYAITKELKNQSEKIKMNGKEYTIGDLNQAIENTGIGILETCIQKAQILSSEQLMEIEFMDYRERPIFEVSVIATMSSGKSTLINSLLHTELLPAENQATTATIAKIYDNDGMDTFEAECYAEDEKTIVHPRKKITKEDIERYNSDKKVTYINIEGNIPGASSDKIRLCLRDTAGPNNARDGNHGCLTESVIRQTNTVVLYVMDATQFDINDDEQLLHDISREMKCAEKQSRDRFIFVVNKCDALDEEKGETVDKLLSNVREYLKKFGIENPILIPTSARMALLIRKARAGEPLTRQEKRELVFVDDFVEYEELHFDEYATLTPSIKFYLQKEVKKYHENEEDWDLEALIHTGIPAIELMLNEYINTYMTNNN